MQRSVYPVPRAYSVQRPETLPALRAALPRVEHLLLIALLSLFWGLILFSALPS